VTDEAYVGVLLADLHFPANRSLKDKRAPLAALRDVCQRRYRASFSEVGHKESWQLARVLVVLAASSARVARERLDDIDRYLHAQEYEVARVVVDAVDAVGSLWPSDS